MEYNLYELLTIPNHTFPVNGEVVIVAQAKKQKVNDDLPCVYYQVLLYCNKELVKTIVLNKGVDGGVISEESLKRRERKMQMTIQLAQYIANLYTEDALILKTQLIKKISCDHSNLKLDIPEDFIMI